MNSVEPKRARGRPVMTLAQKERFRGEIAQCAMKLFQADGYHAVSMRRLASEAGCTVATVYKYFDCKIEILKHLWAQIFSELFDHLEGLARSDRTAATNLETIAQAYVQFWLTHRDHYFLVFMSSDVQQTDVSVFVEQDGIVERFSLIRHVLGAARGQPADHNEVEIQAQVLICGLNGIAHNLITISGYPWVNAEQLVRAMVKGTVET